MPVDGKGTILVVDDNLSTLQTLFQLLRQAGYRVVVAEDGAGALERVKRVTPDLILLDIRMPDMDGFELFEQLRALSQVSDTPIIFLSVVTETPQKVKSLQLSAVDFITKPFEAEEVLARIEKHLMLHRLQKELEEKNRRLQQEIAERKRVEKSLRESEEKFRTIFDNAPVFIDGFDESGRVVLWNKACEETFGWTLEELNSYDNPLALFYPDPEVQTAVLNSVSANPETVFKEWHPRTKRGEKLITLWANFQLPSGVVINIGYDITQRRQAELALQESEKRYRHLVESALVGIATSTTKGDVIYANDTILRILEYDSLAALQEKGVAAHYKNPDDRRKLFELLQESGRVDSYELDLLTRTGKTKTVLVSGSLEKDILNTTWVDITDRKRAEEQIDRFFNLSLEKMCIASPDGYFKRLNSAFTKTLGFSKQELLSRPFVDFIHPDDVGPTLAEVEKQLAGETTIEFENRYRCKDGSYKWLSWRAAAGEEGLLYATARDTTERRQADIDLRKAKESADAANRAKSVFLANMSHELRTPLNGILGYAQFLQEYTPLDQKQQAYAATIERSGHHLLALINDVLDIAKIEAGKITLRPDDFYLAPFLTSINDIIRIRANQKGVELVTAFDSELPSVIRADERRLKEILINLLGNAVKFTDWGRVTFGVEKIKGGRPYVISNEETQRSALLRFTIEDTGPGISTAGLEEIFQPFHQVTNHTHQREGTGLGLAISQYLAELMGSVIQVKSTPGQGSTFWFAIEVPVLAAAPELVETSKTVIKGYEGDRQTVLIIDDIPINRGVVREPLLALGFNVIEAEDGLTGLDLARQRQPDLIVTDIRMPRLDGNALIRQVRQSEQLKTAPIIGVSASTYAEDQKRCLAAGGNAFLPKPLNIDQLLELIKDYLPIQWIYETQEEEQKPAEASTLPMLAPPAEKLAALQQAAAVGDINSLISQLTEIEALGEPYQPFVTRVRRFAKQFQIEALENFLREVTPE